MAERKREIASVLQDPIEFWIRRFREHSQSTSRPLNVSTSPAPSQTSESTVARETQQEPTASQRIRLANETPEQRSARRGAFIEPLLRAKGWSSGDWAKQAEPPVDYNTVDDYLKGITNPRRSTRAALASALGINPDDMPL